MDLVLGLSLTSAAVRWVLVEGTTGEGAPIDRGSLDIPDVDAMDPDLLLDAVLKPDVVADGRIHAVGVTCTGEAASAAASVLDALTARGHRGVIAVSAGDAAAALALGLADITDYDDVAVCIVEPDSAIVALVADGVVRIEDIDRPRDGADAIELTCSVLAALDPADRRPDAIFVIGSDDVDVIVSSVEAITDVPVISAAEADLALARGAALAAAQTVEPAQAPGFMAVLTSRMTVLSAVLVVAVVTFIVSLSVALGLSLTPDSPVAQRSNAEESTPEVVPPPRSAAPSALAEPKLAKTMAVAVPPAPVPVAAPAYAPPPVSQPPAPVYAPPPPPAYQEPRLRDRIIERIPIINRFHEPQR